MAAITTLVNVHEEAPLRVLNFVAARAPDGDESWLSAASTSLAQGDTSGFVRAVIGKRGQVFGEESEDGDVESAFQVVFTEILAHADKAQVGPLVTEATQAITEDAGARGALRLRLLNGLYALLPGTAPVALRLEVLVATIKYASATEQLEKLSRLISHLETEVAVMDLKPADLRLLFEQVSQALAAAGERRSAQRFRMKHLATCAPGAEAAAAKQTAVDAAVGALKDPATAFSGAAQHSLISLAPVAALKDDKEHAALYGLLAIFGAEKLAAYRAYVKTNPKVLSKYGLDATDCESHMRLLSISSLAAEAQQIPYSALAATLEVDEADVEKWVVQAIVGELIEAKIDQLNKQVVVTRYTHRTFADQEWKGLQAQLHAWRGAVRNTLESLKQL
jgi:translation initiation factor 3 subunit M